MRWWWGRGERTDVGWDTELAIPVATYFTMGIVGSVVVVFITLASWLGHLHKFLETGTFLQWWNTWLIPRFLRHWPRTVIWCLICFMVPYIFLMIRLVLEQVLKAWHPVDFWTMFFTNVFKWRESKQSGNDMGPLAQSFQKKNQDARKEEG